MVSGPPPNRPEADLSAVGTLPLLVSPPGVNAPLDLANYTPDLGMMHPAGTVAPTGSLQITPIGPKHLGALKGAIDAYHTKKKGPPPDEGDSEEAKASRPVAEKKPPKGPTVPMPKLPALKPQAPAPKLRPPQPLGY